MRVLIVAIFCVSGIFAQTGAFPPSGSGGGGGAPSGAAGGDLNGTYPNPTHKKITFANTAVPVAPVAALTGTAGNLPNIKGLSYVQTWCTGTPCDNDHNQSAPSALSNALTITDHTANGQTTVTLDTAAPAGVTSKNLYRSIMNAVQDSNGCPLTGSDLCQWKKVNSSPIATATASFSDNVADGSLGVAVPGYDTTGSVAADSFGTILTRDNFGETYTPSKLIFLNPGFDNQGRYEGNSSTFQPTIPPSASAGIQSCGASGGLCFDAVGNNGLATEFHYLAFGTASAPTWPLIGVAACQFDLGVCGSPGIGSATPISLFVITSDFGANQFQIASVGVDGNNTASVNYSLALNETGTPLAIVEAANLDGTTTNQKPNFVGKRATSQTADMLENLDVNGTTRLPFHVLSSGYAAQDLHTPASSAETCSTGQFSHDVNFWYSCVAPNTWKRAALSSF